CAGASRDFSLMNSVQKTRPGPRAGHDTEIHPMKQNARSPLVSVTEMAAEPFRLFFPLGVLAGLIGVSLWPLHFMGVKQFYPGVSHARIMAFGLFGAFILGFLGTAMPRMLSARPLRPWEVLPLLLLHSLMVFAFLWENISVG